MKSRSFIPQAVTGCFLALLLLMPRPASGQTAEPPAAGNIFEALAARKSGEGVVIVYQSDDIRARVGSSLGTGDAQLAQGYRIQVYSGNMRGSRTEAEQRAARIMRVHPGPACYVTYKAPFWRLHVGDYTSYEDARRVMQILRKEMPGISREMYIVRDHIRPNLSKQVE